MKFLISALTTVGLVSGAALVPRQSGCCFQINVGGGPGTGALGQLADGQNRVGTGYTAATYCINNGVITDSSGRGCILTSPTTQFQCDAGATGNSGFSVACGGAIAYNGNTQFYECLVSPGVYNIYTSPGGSQCSPITLSTVNGACGVCSSASSASPTPTPTPTPTVTVMTTATVTGPGTTTTVTGPGTTTTATITGPCSPTTVSVAGPTVTQTTSVAGPTITVSVFQTQTVTAPGTTITSTVAGPTITATTTVAGPTITATAACSPSTITAKVTVTTAGPTTTITAPGGTTTVAGPTVISTITAAGALTTVYVTQTAPANTVTVTQTGPGSTTTITAPGPPASTVTSVVTSAVTKTVTQSSGPSASACSTDVPNTNFQYPHLIIPVSSTSPNTAYGTSYFGTVNSTTSTIFNFDIPASYQGTTCTLIFLLPAANTLQTSSYTLTGSGSIDVLQLTGPASTSTTYNNQPAVAKDLGAFAVTAGSGSVIATGACAAGQTVAYELKATGSLALSYFQDYNAPAIGLYITEC